MWRLPSIFCCCSKKKDRTALKGRERQLGADQGQGQEQQKAPEQLLDQLIDGADQERLDRIAKEDINKMVLRTLNKLAANQGPEEEQGLEQAAQKAVEHQLRRQLFDAVDQEQLDRVVEEKLRKMAEQAIEKALNKLKDRQQMDQQDRRCGKSRRRTRVTV